MSAQIGLGLLLDLLMGDPNWLPHPVRWLGKLIALLEREIRDFSSTAWGLRIAGVLLALITVAAAYFGTWVILWLAGRIVPQLEVFLRIVIIYYSLAARCLAKEAMQIYQALAAHDLPCARKRLSYLVGRDTEGLSEGEVIRGAVETVAENTVDGVISPLFFLFLGGPPLGMAYKAVNTLDSMVGYLNEEYRDLGWASAKLDDLANWIPARLSGVLLPLAGGFWGQNFRKGLQIMWRDRHNHKSPNGGYPEAAIAGLLGIQLGGLNYYFGEPVAKPTIGDPLKPLEKKDIKAVVVTMVTASLLAFGIFTLVAAAF